MSETLRERHERANVIKAMPLVSTISDMATGRYLSASGLQPVDACPPNFRALACDQCRRACDDRKLLACRASPPS